MQYTQQKEKSRSESEKMVLYHFSNPEKRHQCSGGGGGGGGGGESGLGRVGRVARGDKGRKSGKAPVNEAVPGRYTYIHRGRVSQGPGTHRSQSP